MFPKAKRRISTRVDYLIAMALLTTMGPTARADTPAPPGVLLLHNGQVIEGRIYKDGDEYHVKLDDGEIRLQATEVDLYCHDLEDGYQRKRAIARADNVMDHLRLARWCQRQGLFGHAAAELADAMDIDPQHPAIPALQRQLKLAMEKPQEPQQAAATASSGPTGEQLDSMIRGMSPGSVEAYAQFVQPILMNHCANCHNQPTSKLQLMRVTAGQPPARRLTQRNLNAVMQYVDREHPEASRLLTVPQAPHGTAKTAIFSDHQVTQYRRLLAWVYLVTQHPLPQEAATALTAPPPDADAGDDGVLKTLPTAAALARPLRGSRDSSASSAVRSAAAMDAAMRKSGRLTPLQRDQPDQPLRPSVPTPRRPMPRGSESPADGQDPYDPAAFNQQADGGASPAAQPSPPPSRGQ